MALEGKQSFKDSRGDKVAFLQKAPPQQLLEIAPGTALRGDPIVQNYNNAEAPAFYQKTEMLRSRMLKELKDHADFRGMVIRSVAGMGMVVSGTPKGGQAEGQRTRGKS